MIRFLTTSTDCLFGSPALEIISFKERVCSGIVNCFVFMDKPRASIRPSATGHHSDISKVELVATGLTPIFIICIQQLQIDYIFLTFFFLIHVTSSPKLSFTVMTGPPASTKEKSIKKPEIIGNHLCLLLPFITIWSHRLKSTFLLRISS